MKPDRWQRIDEIFHAALQYKPDERKAFIQEASRDDEQNCDWNLSLCWPRREKRTSSLKNRRWTSWRRT